ncbi:MULTISPECIES: imidazolonepropionase [Prevotella]|uniref:Imidazolonepropionase n=1 Tax=Prevotella pectinovora TaxID=1602169 RepID=A0A0D0I2V1_9BACT|nr:MULTISPECIES: imidazolonepropionase [Prevotella]KIP55801.1 imidazolonepropionase [Prevotella pectinovora]KIP60093.1 imidazolonepropionase [Prevotella pectinovora]MCI6048697.1 imidazolonepropionase [Prevotella pectinovora]MEE1546374.1 imidazolonepropionase [Prevotella pectinovora]
MRVLIENIGILAGIDSHGKQRLCGKEMQSLGILNDAWLLVEDGRFAAWGTRAEMPAEGIAADEHVDAEGGAVLPSWCDSHTHIVFAGSREAEFVDKIRGLSYAEIAKRGGGILNSADLLHTLSEDELYRQAMVRMEEVMRKGTGCVEIKSGYGLNTADELKMLHVIKRIKENSPLRVKSTFLGAHAVGRGMTQPDYVDLVVNEMIPEVGKEKLADFVDVFCDEGFFTPAETARILEAADKWGMKPKIHADELASSGGVEVGVAHGALSVDHLESMTVEEIEILRDTVTMPTVLPGTSFFLNLPYGKARQMVDAGLPVAVASDYNPGSTPSGDMKFVVSLACIKLRLLPEEAINAATLNGACAMGESQQYGSIAKGKVANFFITRPIPSVSFVPYAYTTPIVERVFLGGKEC